MAAKLRTDPQLATPDSFYEKLLALHDDLDAEASRRADAALVLVLANHIGDLDVLDEAIALVRKAIR
jgi:uncharacterized protein DUF2783